MLPTHLPLSRTVLVFWSLINKDRIIMCETMYGYEIFLGYRNIENIFEKNRTIGSMNNSMTYMTDIHTCPACYVD
jgi:hypothetical protein